MRLRRFACAALLALLPLAATAQEQADSPFAFGGAQPIEISADNGIEWDREARTYTARGNAVAVQGTSELRADTLVAAYGGSGNQIDRITADGGVKISNPSQTAYGDHAEYDQAKRLLVMTGSALKIENADQTVTARDSFEYWEDQDALVAKGDVAILKSDGTKIDGDEVTSYFHDSAEGKREVFQVKAEGNVRIDTGKEVATCQRAVYDPATRIAVLTGNVVLTQNKNVFRGARAEIDMAKGISRLLPAPGERVRTTIQPKQNSNQGSGVSPTSSTQSGSGTLALDGTAP